MIMYVKELYNIYKIAETVDKRRNINHNKQALILHLCKIDGAILKLAEEASLLRM